jgi:hypothetical protein
MSVVQNVMIPEAQHAVTLGGEVRGSLGAGRSAGCVRTPIDLHNHFVLQAAEVGDETANWLLPLELCISELASSQTHP